MPPSYEAKTRVILNVLNRTRHGATLSPGELENYLETQIELIKDFRWPDRPWTTLGWVSMPTVLSRRSGGRSPDGDVRRWLAQTIIDTTKTRRVGGTNILEITFRSAHALRSSRAMADALAERLSRQHCSPGPPRGQRNADWYRAAGRQGRRRRLRRARQDRLRKSNGIVMAGDKTDIETPRLRSLASQGSGSGADHGAAPMRPRRRPPPSSWPPVATHRSAQAAEDARPEPPGR